MARTRVIIDTDPGVDDAIAILLALASDGLDVLAITTVTGNVPVELTTLNARRLVGLAGRHDVVVARGSDVGLAGEPEDFVVVHGSDGLGDIEWDEPTVTEDPRHAVEVMRHFLDEEPLTIIAIGPLTNLAVLLERHPGIEQRVDRLVVMGGASFEGNVTPAAEFNIWADPIAAERVFSASWPITVMPLDLTHQATLNDDHLARLRSLGNEVGRRCADMLEPYAAFHDEWYGNRDVIMHDAMAVYEVMDPTAIVKQGVRVAVETGGTHAWGATFIDRRREHAQSPVRVGVTVDNDRFVEVLLQHLARYQ